MEFATDRKLADFRLYYNGYSAHGGLAGQPLDSAEDHGGHRADIQSYRWRTHCRGLYLTPIAA